MAVPPVSARRRPLSSLGAHALRPLRRFSSGYAGTYQTSLKFCNSLSSVHLADALFLQEAEMTAVAGREVPCAGHNLLKLFHFWAGISGKMRGKGATGNDKES